MTALNKEDYPLNILVAYPYMDKVTIKFLHDNQKDIRFLLDSGAFTAWKAGNPIDINEYCDFINKLPFKPWRYFMLDVIGDPEGTQENYKIMLKKGLNPIPIFTRGEDLSLIDEYYKTSDVVGLGGLVGTKGNKGFVKGVMDGAVNGRKVHWLGFNAKDFLGKYRPYMCDSSSWSSAVRYAAVKLYDKNGKWYQVGKQDFAKRPPQHIIDLIKSYGIDPKRMAKENEWRNSGKGDCGLEVLTCRSWTRYQIDIKRKLGSNFFLACASSWQVRLMHESWQYWISKGF